MDKPKDSEIKEIVRTAYKVLDKKKAKDICVIDIRDLSVIADYFVIASGDNLRQTGALCDELEDALLKKGFSPRQIEGRETASWILLDYSSVIVHIFDKENRLFYDIERIWKDGKKIVDVDSL